MDRHDLGRGRAASTEEALSRLTSRVLVMGIDSDMLYPLTEQEHLAAHIPNSTLRIIKSPDGHDGFLLEQDQVSRHITEFFATIE